MKKYIIVCLVIIANTTRSFAQDYLEDLRDNENQISLRSGMNGHNGSSQDWNIGARLKTGDNSVKLNAFGTIFRSATGQTASNRNEDEGPEDFSHSNDHRTTSNYLFNYLGFGGYVKGKTEDGLGALFSRGQFTPSTQVGGYLFWKQVKIVHDMHKHTMIVNPFFNLTFSSFQLIPSDTNYKFNKIDTSVNSWNAGLSILYQSYFETSQWAVGLTGTVSKLTNYSDLDKVELKETITKYDTLRGQQTVITKVNDNGYEYGVGTLKTYYNTNLKVNFTYIPSYFKYRVAAVIYPSLDFSELYSSPSFNLGLGVHFLQKDNPGLSVAGLLFELNDMNNAKGKDLPFVKRSFRVGVTLALNVISLVKN